MESLNLFPLFLAGLAGSVHCAGMCGGIVSAFSMGAPARAAAPAFPVAVVTVSAAASLQRTLAYNAGRLASYATAGAMAGGLAGGARTLAGLQAWQAGGYWIANLMLVLLGLYLAGVFPAFARVETLGHGLWRRVRPLTGRLLPLDSPAKLLAMGAVWGWLPCGMVYSVLLTAMLTGSAGAGAAVMLAFGLGTLPLLGAMGMAGASLRAALQQPAVRSAGGLVVFGFGILGLLRAAGGLPGGWMELLCVTPLPA